jgi:hypothetical protein
MFTITQMSRNVQRVVCMVLAIAVVAASVSIGAFGTYSAMHDGYTVTITQLQ